MNNAGYLVAAYLIFWGATVVYLITLHRRHRELNRQLRRLLDEAP